jgi:hypothetical protein
MRALYKQVGLTLAYNRITAIPASAENRKRHQIVTK